ncbi:MAG: LbtU family siderophore porin [Pseudomonadota bacterium]
MKKRKMKINLILLLCVAVFYVPGLTTVLAADATSVIGNISDRITLTGTIELDYSYANDSDISDNIVNDSTSELDIGTVSLGLEAKLHEYVSANAVLKGENLDTDDRIFWDEVFFTFAKDDMPVYFVAGKRTQPFGAFESLFINDPITQDLYEINKTGATIGYADEKILGIDLSFTVYKGESLITRVNDSGFGWTRDNSAGYAVTNDVSSYIVSAAVSPLDGLTLAAYFNCEPGDTDRNDTLGGSLHWEVADFIADAEYIGALNREKHVIDNKEYKESAWFVSLGYQVLDPLILAVRYEDFDADKIQSGNLNYRYGFAAIYTLFKADSFACNLLGEYRRSEYEHTQGSSTDQSLNEIFARLALEF